MVVRLRGEQRKPMEAAVLAFLRREAGPRPRLDIVPALDPIRTTHDVSRSIEALRRHRP